MTAQTLDRPGADQPDPHPGPAQVRAAMAKVAGGIEQWDCLLDRAYAQALEAGSLEPVEAFLAKSWAIVQQVHTGPPPREQRVSRDQFVSDWETRNGRPFPQAA